MMRVVVWGNKPSERAHFLMSYDKRIDERAWSLSS